MAMNSNEFQVQTERIEQLVEQVNSLPDEQARTAALDLLQSLMDLHGAAIARVVELLANSGEAGSKSLAKLGEDPLLCGLMVLYGVHPVPLADRVRSAIAKVQPQIHKQGGSVEFREASDSTVRISVQSTANGCHSSADALRNVAEQAIREAAPEVIEVIADGVPASAQGFVSLNSIQPAIKEESRYEESPA